MIHSDIKCESGVIEFSSDDFDSFLEIFSLFLFLENGVHSLWLPGKYFYRSNRMAQLYN